MAIAALMTAVLLATSTARVEARVVQSAKYGVWEYQHFVGEIEWCGIGTNWPNSDMVLMIRFRPTAIDYFFFNRDWNLGTNRAWGRTIFEVGGRAFAARTDTLGSRQALFGTFTGQVVDLLRRLKAARDMRIDFPTDQSVRVDLRGSGRAVDAAVRCWKRHLTN